MEETLYTLGAVATGAKGALGTGKTFLLGEANTCPIAGALDDACLSPAVSISTSQAFTPF
jgi:hypothetical protein